MSETERPLPKPTDTNDLLVRRAMVTRARETQPYINQALYDTIPGEGSGDQ